MDRSDALGILLGAFVLILWITAYWAGRATYRWCKRNDHLSTAYGLILGSIAVFVLVHWI